MGRGTTSARRTPGWVAGARSVQAALRTGDVTRVVIAKDAPPPLVSSVLVLAGARAVEIDICDSAEELGRICGVGRPVVAAAQVGSSLARSD